jgi:hypothetical protein
VTIRAVPTPNQQNMKLKNSSLFRAFFQEHSVAVVFAMAAFLTGTLQAQITLDPAWRVTPDTNSTGFKWAYFQAGVSTPNSVARAESDLALQSIYTNLGDPTVVGGTVQVAIAPSSPATPFNGLLYFDITNVINLSKADSGAKGYFPDDLLEPGFNINASSDGQSAEILTYITLPAGTNWMGVISDDGFATYAGANPSDAFGRSLPLGAFNGGRGADLVGTVFSFVVQQAGTYPFRTVWENGGGDSNIEWFTLPDGTNKVLINDLENGGAPAYRAISGAINPYIKGVGPTPVLAQTESVQKNMTVLLADGTTAVDTNSITLTVDGQPLAFTVTRLGNQVIVTSANLPGFHVASETHTATLSFKNVGGAYTRNQQWSFVGIENLVLPASPVTGENFDAYAEAPDAAHAAPTGWTLTNYSWLELGASGFGANGGDVWDLTSQANDPFANWCMFSTVTGANLESEILQNSTSQTINGLPITGDNWMSNNVLFAASDGRARHTVDINGANMPNQYAPQIQIAVSAPFNLSSVTNPVLTWSSAVRISGNHEQDTLEYSVDNGSNWLVGIIMQNSSTLFYNPDGTYDALKILTNVWVDLPQFPVVQDTNRFFVSAGPLGGKFGDVLAAPITASLSSRIANRNDGAAARRVEAIRLPEAAKKNAVRLRFVHYGSCGWEWAVDNIAFYDIAPATVQTPTAPHIDSIQASNGSITVKWSNGGTLESTSSLINPTWTSTSNSSGTFTEPVGAGAKFYRAHK